MAPGSRCGDTQFPLLKGVASEVAKDDMDEEEDAEFEDATDDLHDESLVGFPPNEEGANITFPATPLGKKVVTEGREEGPDEGEPWRLAASRRRRRSSNDSTATFFLTNLKKEMWRARLNPKCLGRESP